MKFKIKIKIKKIIKVVNVSGSIANTVLKVYPFCSRNGIFISIDAFRCDIRKSKNISVIKISDGDLLYETPKDESDLVSDLISYIENNACDSHCKLYITKFSNDTKYHLKNEKLVITGQVVYDKNNPDTPGGIVIIRYF